MPKFRKKPVEIEAVQFTATEPNGAFLREWSDHQVRYHDGSTCYIDTLEGTMEARVGDWIIKGVKGEFYPCKPDIFAATYEEVEA